MTQLIITCRRSGLAVRARALLGSLGLDFWCLRFVAHQQVPNNRLVGVNRPFEFLRPGAIQFKIGLKVVALIVFLDWVGKGPFAPDIGTRHFSAGVDHKRSNFVNRLGTLIFTSVITENPDQFVLSQRSTVFFQLARNRFSLPRGCNALAPIFVAVRCNSKPAGTNLPSGSLRIETRNGKARGEFRYFGAEFRQLRITGMNLERFKNVACHLFHIRNV